MNKDANNADFLLIERVLNGEDSAFSELVQKYQDKVFNICYRFLMQYEEANDCAQDVFVKVYRSLKTFKYQSSFATWIYIVTVNTCKNRVMSLRYKFLKKIQAFNKDRDNENRDIIENFGDEKYSPLRKYESEENMKIIEEAIFSLSPEHKAVIILRDVENLSYDEISRINNCKLGTVKSKLARAREILKTKLIRVLDS